MAVTEEYTEQHAEEPTKILIPGSEKFDNLMKPPSELVISPTLPLWTFEGDRPSVDSVTYQVVSHKLLSIVEEQEETIRKVSGSPVANEAHDYNVALMDEHGDIVQLGYGITFQGFVLDPQVKWTLEHRSENPGIEEGDMFLCNDPWIGCLHQSDVGVYAPVFVDGKLFAWTGATIHQIDVGGVDPGSFCISAPDNYSEGKPWPPTKLVRRGIIQEDIEDLFLRSSRAAPLVKLDLRAFVSCNLVAQERLFRVIEKYGAAVVKAVMAQMQDYAEQRFRERLRELPDGKWRHVDYQEMADKHDRGIHRCFLTMTKEGDELLFDYTGSDPNAGMINTTVVGGTFGGVLTALIPFLCYDVPWALGGIKRAITITAPKGTVINAQFPYGCSGGAVTGTWTSWNCANNVIAKMMAGHPELSRHMMSGCVGAWTTVDPFGIDQRGDVFITMIMDCMSGGFGARSWADGIDTGGLLCTPTGQVPNVETNELFFPLLYLFRREETDSGGAGRWRGGMGASSCWIPHDTPQELTLTLATFGASHPTSSGICGGYPANSCHYVMVRNTDTRERFRSGYLPSDWRDVSGEAELLNPKWEGKEGIDDVFYHLWPGGGGYGDPLDREPERVCVDVRNAAVSVDAARQLYGVVLDPATLEVDEAATVARRDEMRRERLS